MTQLMESYFTKQFSSKLRFCANWNLRFSLTEASLIQQRRLTIFWISLLIGAWIAPISCANSTGCRHVTDALAALGIPETGALVPESPEKSTSDAICARPGSPSCCGATLESVFEDHIRSHFSNRVKLTNARIFTVLSTQMADLQGQVTTVFQKAKEALLKHFKTSHPKLYPRLRTPTTMFLSSLENFARNEAISILKDGKIFIAYLDQHEMEEGERGGEHFRHNPSSQFVHDLTLEYFDGIFPDIYACLFYNQCGGLEKSSPLESCLRKSAKDFSPFGYYPPRIIENLKNPLFLVRSFFQALETMRDSLLFDAIGADADNLDSGNHHHSKKFRPRQQQYQHQVQQCTRALTKMSHCKLCEPPRNKMLPTTDNTGSHFKGSGANSQDNQQPSSILSLIPEPEKPQLFHSPVSAPVCVNYCVNVMAGCLSMGGMDSLSNSWDLMAVGLHRAMKVWTSTGSNPHENRPMNFDQALAVFPGLVMESLMHVQHESGEDMWPKQVENSCGTLFPEGSRKPQDPADWAKKGNLTSRAFRSTLLDNVHPIAPQMEMMAQNLTQFIGHFKRLPFLLCEMEHVNEGCWNGTAIGSYSLPVAVLGALENPEVSSTQKPFVSSSEGMNLDDKFRNIQKTLARIENGGKHDKSKARMGGELPSAQDASGVPLSGTNSPRWKPGLGAWDDSEDEHGSGDGPIPHHHAGAGDRRFGHGGGVDDGTFHDQEEIDDLLDPAFGTELGAGASSGSGPMGIENDLADWEDAEGGPSDWYPPRDPLHPDLMPDPLSKSQFLPDGGSQNYQQSSSDAGGEHSGGSNKGAKAEMGVAGVNHEKGTSRSGDGWEIKEDPMVIESPRALSDENKDRKHAERHRVTAVVNHVTATQPPPASFSGSGRIQAHWSSCLACLLGLIFVSSPLGLRIPQSLLEWLNNNHLCWHR